MTWLSRVSPEVVSRVDIRWPDGSEASFTREERADVFLMRGPGGRGADSSSVSPAIRERVHGAIQLCAELERLPGVAGTLPADGPTVTFTIRGEQSPRVLRLAGSELGGKTGVVIEGGPDSPTRTVMADAALSAVFAREGVTQWRSLLAFPAGAAGASHLSMTQGAASLELARTQNRWGLQQPLAAPADPQKCAELVGRLARLSATRLSGGADPIPGDAIVIEVERELRHMRGPDVVTSTLRQRLKLGGPANAEGTLRHAEMDAAWMEVAGPQPAWGPVRGLVPASDAADISLSPELLIARQMLDVPLGDLRELRVWSPADDATAFPRVLVRRSGQGWERVPLTGAPAMLDPADAAGPEGVAVLLAQAGAASVVLEDPAGLSPLARISPASGGPLGEPVMVSLATVPVASGPQQVVVLSRGGVRWVHVAGKHEAAIAWLSRAAAL